MFLNINPLAKTMEEIEQVYPEIIEKCIAERRSIRVFTEKGVENKNVIKILEAGNWAPSAGNLQSRRFVVVQTLKGRKKIMECVKSARIAKTGKSKIMKAPVFIVICADLKKCRTRYIGRKGLLFAIQDVAASAQNMALMAHSLGLGSCWIGNFDESAIISRFGLKDGLFPMTILAVGYPEYKPLPPKRFSVDEIAEFDSEADAGTLVYEL
jgi:nitroreductase